MYVLVLIMTFQGNMKVQAFHSLFPDWQTCNQVSLILQVVGIQKKDGDERHPCPLRLAHLQSASAP